ncbi:MAG: hypothetical protein R3A80_07660 [Bdellovibrionota bacterium]
MFKKKIKETAEKVFEKAKDEASSKVKLVSNRFEESGIKDQLKKKAAQAQGFLDEHGVTEKAKQIGATTSDHLDTLSGAKLLKLVEERLALQSKYNDILATKLDEALNRIQQLEKKLQE